MPHVCPDASRGTAFLRPGAPGTPAEHERPLHPPATTAGETAGQPENSGGTPAAKERTRQGPSGGDARAPHTRGPQLRVREDGGEKRQGMPLLERARQAHALQRAPGGAAWLRWCGGYLTPAAQRLWRRRGLHCRGWRPLFTSHLARRSRCGHPPQTGSPQTHADVPLQNGNTPPPRTRAHTSLSHTGATPYYAPPPPPPNTHAAPPTRTAPGPHTARRHASTQDTESALNRKR